MKKLIISLIASIAVSLGIKADITADWKLHMPFDQWPTAVVETPTRVYFMVRTFENRPSLPERSVASHSLFYYDKSGNETVSINARTTASDNAVACIGYNYEKKYLLVVYTNSDIDFIYDNGKIYNLKALEHAQISGGKEANSITFDAKNNLAYIATDFGYISLNDEKHEVADSRIYGEEFTAVAPCGDNFVAASEGGLLVAPMSSRRYNLSDYTALADAPQVERILPLDDGAFLGYSAEIDMPFFIFTPGEDGSYTWEQAGEDPHIICHQEMAGGYFMAGNVKVYQISKSGEIKEANRLSPDWRCPTGSLDGFHIWCLAPQKGMRSYTMDWGLRHDYMRPNAPATYIATSLVYHPTYGMLAGSNGADLALNTYNQQTPCNVSALKGGLWKEYGPLYTAPEKFVSTSNYRGLAVDPQNTDIIYRNNTTGGLLRLNLAHPEQMMIMAQPHNANSKCDGFVTVAEDQAVWDDLCRFTLPRFGTDGTMWTVFNNHNASRSELWYWPAADRLASISPATFRPMKKINLPALANRNDHEMIVLSKTRNIIVISGFDGQGSVIMLYNFNGTPDNTTDDRYVVIKSPQDQDGGTVDFGGINGFVEDPSTGLVWILAERGLFTLNPVTAFENPGLVNRIKVARNDGTNLADYLLNEVNVLDMCIDGEGRKWFATASGLVCTAADGRSILGEFTTEDSYLPGEAIYAVAFNPENNSLMVATEGGLAEMFPSGSGGSSGNGASSIRAYPNPVEPDFYGYVRIDNIPEGSLVKITDAGGGLVKELGLVSGGSVEWDISGHHNRRVASGVYYVMVSPGSSGGSTQISKILVLN